MTPLEIQFELKKRSITQTEIAEKVGVTPMAVSKVVRKESVSDRIMRAVAKAIGRDHRELFPEHYFSKRRKNAA